MQIGLQEQSEKGSNIQVLNSYQHKDRSIPQERFLSKLNQALFHFDSVLNASFFYSEWLDWGRNESLELALHAS